MTEYKDGRGDYYFRAAVQEGRVLCRCGHKRSHHEDPDSGQDCPCWVEVWDGEFHGGCPCKRWVADPSKKSDR